MVWADVFQAGVLLVGLLAVVIQVKSRSHVSSKSPFLYRLKMGSMTSNGAVYTTHQKNQRCRLLKW